MARSAFGKPGLKYEFVEKSTAKELGQLITERSTKGKLRCTSQRLLVVEKLLDTDGEHTAEELWLSLRNGFHQISIGSVYRNLKMLVALGLAETVEKEKKIVRYRSVRS